MLVRTALNVLAAGFVLTGKALVAARLRSVPDGWREVIGVVLRGEPSKFGVSAFGLTVPGASESADFNANAATQLAAFLQSEPEARYRLRHGTAITTRHAHPHVDLVVQRFSADGALERIEPHLATSQPDETDTTDREKAHAAIVTAYNRTRHLPEATRPMELLAELRGAISGHAAVYANRLLSAACASFESVPSGSARFAPPEFRARRALGYGFLTFVIRPQPENGTVDVWTLAHHVGTDGLPLQELSSRLERAWSTVPVPFPEGDGTCVVGPRPCFHAGEREAYESLSFHDFSPLLALRKKLNAKLGAEVGGDITFGCLFLWRLAREPEFAGVKFGSTVDVAARGKSERDVDLVTLRPADFSSDDAGLVKCARAFNEVVVTCRERTSPVRKAIQTAALLPTWLHGALLHRSPDAVRDTFGGVGLSVLKDAKVFVAPLSDVGYPGGFFAIGGVGLPTASGRPVGAVSVKGERAMAERYPAILHRMLEGCREG